MEWGGTVIVELTEVVITSDSEPPLVALVPTPTYTVISAIPFRPTVPATDTFTEVVEDQLVVRPF